MKRNLLLIAFIHCLLYSNAQIVIESTDIIQTGMTIERVKDTITTVQHGSDGANQTWTFTNVSPHVQINTSSVTPSSTPNSSYNSTANQALTNDSQTWIYMNLTSSNYIAKGVYGNVLGNGNNINVPLNPDQTMMIFPTVYGNNYTDTYQYDITLSGSDVDMAVYQVRNKRNGIINDTIKGWGQLTTPIGIYNSLKGKRVEVYYDSVWTKLTSFVPWVLYSSETGTTFNYYWLSKEGKLAVAEISNSGRLTWTLIPAIPIANFTYNDTGEGTVDFVNQSMNTPTSYSWDFGDGSPFGSVTNPSHQYTNNGTYNVCLIATNASGSDTICQDVVISTITGIKSNTDIDKYIVFPNPNDGIFTIKSNVTINYILIQNIIGETIYAAEINTDKADIDLSKQAKGIYFYLLQDNSNVFTTGKIIIK